MAQRTGMLTVPELQKLVDSGGIDTVIISFTDMQGRLVGKRMSARLFVEDAIEHGAECCNYLLAVDVENNTVPGYEFSSWEKGYNDMAMIPDMSTLRLVPWIPHTAMVIADLQTTDHVPVPIAPRSLLSAQVDRLAKMDLVPYVGTELEFIVFDDSFREAWAKGYDNLRPSTDYNVDYDLLASNRVEPLLHDIRVSMDKAGLYCEGVKGECNLGQQEIAFRYDTALITCDNHSVYKSGAKMIADNHGKSLTFMAKFNEREGNSCHIHISFRDSKGNAVFADKNGESGMSDMFRHFLAGQIALMREFTLLFAPNINSYKRFAFGSFAPTAIAWGHDNRTLSLRVVGHGHGMRVEHRVPGGDVNQYLAVAGLIAAGIHGIENKLELEDQTRGNGYEADKPHVPTTLHEAADLFENSKAARAIFGDEVVNHLVNAARIEIRAFDSAITDWERVRGFERL
ncbi:MAG: glutamine synthetase [Microbacteriaceae bacterium]|nr:glutamine synthetase [Microbacteriaceae bacterium]